MKNKDEQKWNEFHAFNCCWPIDTIDVNSNSKFSFFFISHGHLSQKGGSTNAWAFKKVN